MEKTGALDFTQPNNDLSRYADAERKDLLPINDYSNDNSYSRTHPDALADGDELGRGTGIFLDYRNPKAGTSFDIQKRDETIAINKYSEANGYKKPE